MGTHERSRPRRGRRSRPARDIDRACAHVSRDQHGVLSLAQARTAGLSLRAIARRLESGRWERLHPGVYRIAGAPASWEQSLIAACLHAGKGAVVSHRAAAALWRLDGVEQGVVELIAPRRIRRPGVVAHQTTLPRRRSTHVGTIPVTDVARTLLDLGAVVPGRVVEAALEDALRRRLTTLARLRRRLRADGGRGHRGAGVLRALVEARDPSAAPAESVLESRLGRLLANSDLPPATAQHVIRGERGFLARVDFAFPDAMVVVEADGYRYHSGAAAWARDRARENVLTARGWRVYRVTHQDLLARPERVVADLRRMLAANSRH